MTRCPTCGAVTAPASYSSTDTPEDWLARTQRPAEPAPGQAPDPLPHGAWERIEGCDVPVPGWWHRWRQGLHKRHGGEG